MGQAEAATEKTEAADETVRISRPTRMAGIACLAVLLIAIYVGYDVNRAIGQSKNLYDVSIPAARILSDIQYEAQECRHAAMHAASAANDLRREAFLTEFTAHRDKVDELLVGLAKLRIPADGQQKIADFEQNWHSYVKMQMGGSPAPGGRDRQFQVTSRSGRQVQDYLDTYSKSSAGAVRMAFVRSGFELVLLLLGTLHMISVLATNGQKRKAFESLRLMNQRLTTARAAAEESSKLKSEFLATVSHEIRTPMNGIIGMAELLARSPLSEEQRSYNETVRTSAEALLAILNDILDFSRIEAGKLVIDNSPFQLSEPAFQMADLLGPAAGQKGLEFIVRMAPELPKMVVGDAGRIRQILMNLAGNAIKFTHSGHILVEAEPVELDSQNCRVRFAVQDTGIGIPANKLDTLFEKFTQADSSTTRRYGGTGLGLAISRKLVELMGGTMRVDSVVGQGSTFSFEVSFALASSAAHGPQPAATSGGPKVRILLIEPQDVSARVIGEMLEVLGVDRTIVSTATEAAAIVEKNPADWHAILASSRAQVEQPGEFVRLQRLLGKGNRLILMTTRGRVESIAQTRIVRLLYKPIQPAILEEALKLTLNESLALAQPHQTPVVMGRDLQQLSISLHRESAAALRVLVAEDNLVNQTIVKKLLEEAGCRVDVANNGVQAIDRWEEGGYDLILMDCQMPELDGFDATREIRKREGGRERVPIVAITANVLDKDRNHCFAVGMDDFLSKPLRLRQLREVVTRWSPAERASRAAPAKAVKEVAGAS